MSLEDIDIPNIHPLCTNPDCPCIDAQDALRACVEDAYRQGQKDAYADAERHAFPCSVTKDAKIECYGCYAANCIRQRAKKVLSGGTE